MVSSSLLTVVLLIGAVQAVNLPTITKKPTLPTKTVKPKCTVTKCVDKVNSCGKKYGGCYESCPGSPEPTFSPPPCSTSQKSSSVTPISTCPTLCVDYVNDWYISKVLETALFSTNRL